MSPGTLSIAEALALALGHHRAGRLTEAEPIYRQILAAQPDHADALHLLGIIAHQMQHDDDAVALISRAIELKPHEHFFNNLGSVLKGRGQLDLAAQWYRRAIARNPEYADPHCNLALVLLMQGRYAEGFALHEWRRKTVTAHSIRLSLVQPLWDGAPLNGRTLLLHFEQGLGDTLFCVRYVALILAREPDAKLIVECQPELKGLLARSLPRCRVIDPHEPLPAFDVQLPLLSLPLAFGTTVESIPCRVPYLMVDPDEERRWRDRLEGGSGTIRVGLVWAGGTAHAEDAKRSLALAAFAPLGAVRRAAFYSLQKGEASKQAADPPGFPLTDFTADLHDFDDTAALLANLDLVITVDTSVAHLAGALGKPVWALLPYVADWRWLLEREDSPWFPSLRLFRQREIGNWAPVIAEVAGALGKL